MKRTWVTPKLIALVRGMPEELVLTGCKAEVMAGPGNAAPGCFVTNCQNCSGYSET